ncbi:sulfotransferase 4A1-like [Belonocnema kinseyi]|uniref:sulfotransferase 4A1-like n=1 Tax=Belonocnema kinseyi TaxID=2817044 RepID=UPI00143CCE25|nr:sulfotransferase 4A1-like [Belonocnema kinseyi]
MSSQPPNYTLLDADKTKEMLTLFNGERTGWVQAGEKKWFFPYKYTEEREGFYNFKPRPSDTWIISHPRSGTTVTQELIWLLSNNLDFETARKKTYMQRFPYLESSMDYHSAVMDELVKKNEGNLEKQEFCKSLARPVYETLEALPSPRFIQSHMPLSLKPGILDSGCKIIYMARNPKDVAVSWYIMHKSVVSLGYVGDFPTFWNYFKNDLTVFSPYWEHVKEAWAQRNHPNLLFMFYEELRADLLSAAKKVANFLGKNYNENQLSKLLDHLNIDNFRKNPAVNLYSWYNCGVYLNSEFFIGKGKTGNWKEFFSAEMEKEADEWITKNLEDTDLVFPIINTKDVCH